MAEFFCYYRKPGFVWFRFYGYGLCIKDVTRHGLLFSERVLGRGYRPCTHGFGTPIRIGKYIVEYLKP